MAHVLDGMTVFDPEGRAIRLGQLWTDRLAVLVFVRHFGCIFCRQQLATLIPLAARIRELGAELFVVGNGSVEEARAFCEEQHPPCRVFTDPTRRTYAALQMRRGIRSIISPRVLTRGFDAWRRGFRQSRIAGDALQQGGVVVVGPGGVEYYRFISRESGDHPPAAGILAAVEPATVRR